MKRKDSGWKGRSMFLQKAVLWPEACVIGRYRITENNKGTDGLAYEYVPAKSRRLRSPPSDRRGFRICKTASDDGLKKWQVSQSFWRVFVESKTRISDRMTKIVWPRVSEAYSLWGIKHIGRLAAKIVRNLFWQVFDAKNLNAPPVKRIPPTGLADDSQSGNATDSVVGCQIVRNPFDGFRW